MSKSWLDQAGLEIRLSTNTGEESHPCAKAMDSILRLFMEEVGKHYRDPKTRLSEMPPQAFIVMMINNIFMNMFLQCYEGDNDTILDAATKISNSVKDVFMDCVQKVLLTTADEKIKH